MSQIQVGGWYKIKPDANQGLLKIDTDTDEEVVDKTVVQVWFNDKGWVLAGINKNITPYVFPEHLFFEYFEQVAS